MSLNPSPGISSRAGMNRPVGTNTRNLLEHFNWLPGEHLSGVWAFDDSVPDLIASHSHIHSEAQLVAWNNKTGLCNDFSDPRQNLLHGREPAGSLIAASEVTLRGTDERAAIGC